MKLVEVVKTHAASALHHGHGVLCGQDQRCLPEVQSLAVYHDGEKWLMLDHLVLSGRVLLRHGLLSWKRSFALVADAENLIEVPGNELI